MNRDSKNDSKSDQHNLQDSATYEFSRSFDEEKNDLISDLLMWSQSNRSIDFDLTSYESIVMIKNSFRTVTRENQASRKIINGARSGLGSDMASLSNDPKYVKLSQLTDTILLDGVLSIEYEHVGRDALGREFIFRSFKRRLDELKDPELHLLLMSRPMALVSNGNLERRRNLNELLVLFQQLDEIDQRICFGDTRGETTKHIAATIGMTARSVELRRHKIMEHLGFSRTVEIIILIVRLAENGLIAPLD